MSVTINNSAVKRYIENNVLFFPSDMVQISYLKGHEETQIIEQITSKKLMTYETSSGIQRMMPIIIIDSDFNIRFVSDATSESVEVSLQEMIEIADNFSELLYTTTTNNIYNIINSNKFHIISRTKDVNIYQYNDQIESILIFDFNNIKTTHDVLLNMKSIIHEDWDWQSFNENSYIDSYNQKTTQTQQYVNLPKINLSNIVLTILYNEELATRKKFNTLSRTDLNQLDNFQYLYMVLTDDFYDSFLYINDLNIRISPSISANDVQELSTHFEALDISAIIDYNGTISKINSHSCGTMRNIGSKSICNKVNIGIGYNTKLKNDEIIIYKENNSWKAN